MNIDKSDYDEINEARSSTSTYGEGDDKFSSLPRYQQRLLHLKSNSSTHRHSYHPPSDEHIESFDYDAYESRVNKQHEYDMTIDKYNLFQFKRWILTLFVGLGTAFIGIFIERYTEFFMEFKMHYFTNASQGEFDEGSSKENVLSSRSFLVYAGVNSVYIMIASFLVAFIAPPAKGSGITEIKATLNGIKIHNLLSLKTLFCKAIGVLFSVAAGLPIGKEGVSFTP